MRRITPLLAAALVVFTVGSASAAKDAKKMKPMRSAPVAAHGYCPVAYVAMGKAVKGDPKFASTLDGHRYLFVNADAKKMFDADPGKFGVAYDSWCATAMAMGKEVKSDPTLFTVRDGRTFLFSNADAKKAFDDMADDMIGKADANWAKLGMKSEMKPESKSGM